VPIDGQTLPIVEFVSGALTRKLHWSGGGPPWRHSADPEGRPVLAQDLPAKGPSDRQGPDDTR
jgi:hypothetical protein